MATFSQELFDDICIAIGQGSSLRSICSREGMPATSTFMKWVAENSTLAEQYARAMQLRADHMFEDILDIADHTDNDTIYTEGGGAMPNSEWISRSRLRVDARKWMLGKMHPKKYGDKTAVDVTSGGDKITWNEVKTYNKE